jgi:hypothetical protein
MSQLVATQSVSFFDKSRDFAFQGQFTYENDTFALAQSGFEQKDYDGQNSGSEAQYYGKGSKYSSYYQYSTAMYNTYGNSNTSFYTKFPRAADYTNQESIVEAFPHLESMNNVNFDLSTVSDNAHFYIMRSSNDDNVHKAIKYHMWSTTTGGKATLSNAWKEAEKQGLAPEIYLIFSVVNSNHILGIAKMTSDIKDDDSFMYWWEPAKWYGSFQLEWVFVKDIHHAKFEHIREEGFGTSPLLT